MTNDQMTNDQMTNDQMTNAGAPAHYGEII